MGFIHMSGVLKNILNGPAAGGAGGFIRLFPEATLAKDTGAPPGHIQGMRILRKPGCHGPGGHLSPSPLSLSP